MPILTTGEKLSTLPTLWGAVLSYIALLWGSRPPPLAMRFGMVWLLMIVGHDNASIANCLRYVL